jgi:hypothetical protein
MRGGVLMYVVGRSKADCSVVHFSTYKCPSGSFSFSGDGMQMSAEAGITRPARHSTRSSRSVLPSLLMTLEVVLTVCTYGVTGGDCVGNAARTGEMINMYNILVGKLDS